MLDLSSPVVVYGHSGRPGHPRHTEHHPLCLRCLCHTGQLSLGVPALSLTESKVIVQFGICLWHVELDVAGSVLCVPTEVWGSCPDSCSVFIAMISFLFIFFYLSILFLLHIYFFPASCLLCLFSLSPFPSTNVSTLIINKVCKIKGEGERKENVYKFCTLKIWDTLHHLRSERWLYWN